MAGLVVAPSPGPVLARRAVAGLGPLVLVAVALGFLFGAMACASGLTPGLPHGAHHSSIPDHDVLPAAHQHDLGVSSASPTAPDHDRGESSGPAGSIGHPGMACVTAVELGFPEAFVVAVSEIRDAAPSAMRSGCAADVDPPVPRPS